MRVFSIKCKGKRYFNSFIKNDILISSNGDDFYGTK